MPVDYSKYPPYWKKLSRHIRFVRAGNRCEWCGVQNGAIGARDNQGQWWDESDIHVLQSSAGYALFGDFPKTIRIVLTVAHLDHDTQNNRFSNLAALCQRCHLAYDQEHHRVNAARTRAKNRHQARLAAGQMTLWGAGNPKEGRE